MKRCALHLPFVSETTFMFATSVDYIAYIKPKSKKKETERRGEEENGEEEEGVLHRLSFTIWRIAIFLSCYGSWVRSPGEILIVVGIATPDRIRKDFYLGLQKPKYEKVLLLLLSLILTKNRYVIHGFR